MGGQQVVLGGPWWKGSVARPGDGFCVAWGEEGVRAHVPPLGGVLLTAALVNCSGRSRVATLRLQRVWVVKCVAYAPFASQYGVSEEI